MTINFPARTPLARFALACSLAAAALLVPVRASAQGAMLRLDHLDQLATHAKEHVEVALDSNMLQMASGFLSAAKNASVDAKTITDIVAGLKGVYVRNYEFETEGGYSDQDIQSVRTQLKAPWARIVNVQDNGKKESVEVYMWPDGAVSGGLAILVAEAKELTIVNIVGRVDIAQIAALAGKFGIPQDLGLLGASGAGKPSK
jgi:hypothetical protein